MQWLGDLSYSGDESYRYIDALLASDEDLDIVTPYISSRYAQALSRHAGRRRVRVITSGAEQNRAALRALGSTSASRWLKSALFSAVVATIALLLGLYYAFAILSAMALLFAATSCLSRKRRKANLFVKVISKPFIHEKIYLSSKAVITGSANLTYSGTRKNIEHIEVSTSTGKVEEMQRHFEAIWSDFE